jgi:hypothetical protein
LGLKRCSTIAVAGCGIGVVRKVGFTSRKGIMVVAAIMGQRGKRGKQEKREKEDKKNISITEPVRLHVLRILRQNLNQKRINGSKGKKIHFQPSMGGINVLNILSFSYICLSMS